MRRLTSSKSRCPGIGTPRMRVSRNRNPTRLTRARPWKRSISVPRGTSRSILARPTSKFAMQRNRQAAARNGAPVGPFTPSRRRTLEHHPQEGEENDRAHGGGHQRPERAVRLEPDEREDESADQRPDDADDDVADETKTAAARDLPRQPSGDRPDQEEPDPVHASLLPGLQKTNGTIRYVRRG